MVPGTSNLINNSTGNPFDLLQEPQKSTAHKDTLKSTGYYLQIIDTLSSETGVQRPVDNPEKTLDNAKRSDSLDQMGKRPQAMNRPRLQSLRKKQVRDSLMTDSKKKKEALRQQEKKLDMMVLDSLNNAVMKIRFQDSIRQAVRMRSYNDSLGQVTMKKRQRDS
ncbi:MAG: hypothetical protein HGA46_11135, partial [Chlorobiaceae bacterium]|nr:hypothetical protein [Chlorobiaceae bacterium]